MRKILKHLYKDTKIGHWLIYPFKKIYDFYQLHLLPERIYIRRTFKRTLGYNLNLENPKTINEKVQWFQQNSRTPLHTLCTDKYAVRKYVVDKIGEEHLIQLILHTTDVSEIVPENLPDYPFIIKTNHGCGGHVTVKDKTKIDWNRLQKYFKRLLKRNFYYKTREWQYKDIKPRIIIEKLLFDKNYNEPLEYKYHCVDGKISFCSIIKDRYTNYKMSNYDSEWNFIPWGRGKHFDIKHSQNKLKILKKMQILVEKLALDFRFVRVDFYSVGSKNYFGEMTFSPHAGYDVFDPPIWDEIFGAILF